MSSLKLFTSNRLENLADELARSVSTPLSSPFSQDVIVVQSSGMERWICMELAARHGICANIRFPFPNAFIFELIRKTFPDLPEHSVFEPKIMTWRIMTLLPSLISQPGFESIKAYLEETEGDLKRFQLSQRIADTFDQYLLFRPEMMMNWEQGKEDHWQAMLWRELAQGHENEHRAELGKALIDLLENPSERFDGFPERISVFGISTLPKFHMQVFASLSKHIRVNLFLMNPCMEYWGDIVSDWETIKAIGRGQTQLLSREDLHLEKGNSLLVSMGALGREFFDLINEFDYEDIPSFQEPGDKSLLTCIQSDILNLRERAPDSDGKMIVSEKDTSVQIHSCHSPMRELEVLQDRLLEMFENDPDLKPKDILVMTPDIEAYAPYIQAVFDVPESDSRRIPFSIADRSVKAEGRVIETFLAILGLRHGRFTTFQVMNILESQAVQHRFDLSESDIELLRQWIEDTGIRWGVNGPNRGEMGLPDLPENTWKAGLDRLLLGYAMPGREEDLFEGVLPFDNMEGGNAAVLGRFLEFTDRLFLHVKKLGKSRILEEWSGLLKAFFENFFLPDEAAQETQIIRHTLNDLAEAGRLSGFAEKVDVDTIKQHLEQRLDKEGFGFGFMTGGLTFCAMLPMRSIPFKIICLIGINGDSYPRQSKPLGFDLMAKHPKKGDRSRRNDDRYLFLEAMLSSRQILYISYVGQSIRDNTIIPPSVLANELMDYIEKGFKPHDRKIPEQIVTKHRLQPFSPEYYRKNGKLFSYSRKYYEAALSISKHHEDPVPFISRGLSIPEQTWKTIDVDDLCAFFIHPTKFLLNRRLGIYLDEGAAMFHETEPFAVSGLENYQLAQNLMERRLAGQKLKAFFRPTRAAGLLPHGSVGECFYDELSRGIEDFAQKIAPYIHDESLTPYDIELNVSGFTLTGRISHIYPERIIRFRYARIKAKDMLRGWIHHLILNYAEPPGYPRRCMVAGLDNGWAAWEFPPVEDAEAILTMLLEKYWEGLVRPVHFFPESSSHYAQLVLEKQISPKEALQKARNTWTGDDFIRGESEDPHYRLCFGNKDPVDSEFQETALDVFCPIVASQRNINETSRGF